MCSGGHGVLDRKPEWCVVARLSRASRCRSCGGAPGIVTASHPDLWVDELDGPRAHGLDS